MTVDETREPRQRSRLLSPGMWLGIAFSVLCLWLAFRRVPFGELGDALSRADYLWLVPAFGLHLLAVWVRAARWQTLLGARGILADTFWAQAIGFLFTNAFPLRMGEPARIVTLAGRSRLPLMGVAASVVVERMLDVGTILVLLVVTLPWMDVPPLVLRAGEIFALILAAGALGLLFLVRMRGWTESLLRRILERLHLPADGLVHRWREIVEGLKSLSRPATALRSLGLSLIVWALYVGFYWCVLRAFRPDPALVEAAFMVVALALAISVPSSPGFIGVYQLAGQQALVLPFGTRYDAISALAVTLVSHVIYFVLTSILGAIGLWLVGGSLGGLWRRLRDPGRWLASEPSAQDRVPVDEQ